MSHGDRFTICHVNNAELCGCPKCSEPIARYEIHAWKSVLHNYYACGCEEIIHLDSWPWTPKEELYYCYEPIECLKSQVRKLKARLGISNE
jgi:hypothetical protein